MEAWERFISRAGDRRFRAAFPLTTGSSIRPASHTWNACQAFAKTTRAPIKSVVSGIDRRDTMPNSTGDLPTLMNRFVFPNWSNRFTLVILTVFGVGLIYVACLGAYGTSPETLNVGYSPEQPVPFSHKLHAGTLRMDCRYCHNTVDVAAHAAVPPTATCTNCHSAANSDGSVATSAVHTSSPKLLGVRESQATGLPIEWEKIHDLPDYAYFDHSVHVNRGVGCVSCHGRIDHMEQVYQAEPLSMSWCLDCHRDPEKHLRPLDRITDMDWAAEDQLALGTELRQKWNINPSTNCSTCHR